MPRQPRFKFFARGEGGDIFGWMNKGKGREYTPKTAVRFNLKNSMFRRLK